MQPPQEQDGPIELEHASNFVRVRGSDDGLRIEKQFDLSGKYTHAFSLLGPDAVREFRDLCDAWLDQYDPSEATERPQDL